MTGPDVVGPGARPELADLAAEVDELRALLVAAELRWAPSIARVDGHHLPGAINLVHYWALRQRDLRGLQQRLAAFGLSSLGRSEPHVRPTLDAIAVAVESVAGHGDGAREPIGGFADGPRLLQEHAVGLFGPQRPDRRTRIMVTLPTEAATDGPLVRSMVGAGMDLARVNCAHDGPAAWAEMIGHVRTASAATGRDCRVAMDLAGPKLRTGPLTDGPRVVKIRPRRDPLGRVLDSAHCWLTAADDPRPAPVPGTVVLPVTGGWLRALEPADLVELVDTRGSRRRLVVKTVTAAGVLAAADRTSYLATGTRLRVRGKGSTRVATLPPLELELTLRTGDLLVLTRDRTPAAATPGSPRIGCTLPEAFGHVLTGQTVHLDDGRISGTVSVAGPDQFTVTITDAADGGSHLRAEKGINLPDTDLPVSALTDSDRIALPFVSTHADVVELSFVRGPRDVEDLLAALDDLGDHTLGVVLKIETALAFENLPEILLTLMRRSRAGVMIARGDLASECGYERLAELQEEILWLCEAAHLPVIWATQVLDQMARSGLPSRAEITDAAMGARAECVMLNKGSHILDAVESLADILRRMSGHHDKKNALLRPLRSWPPAIRATAGPDTRSTPAAAPSGRGPVRSGARPALVVPGRL